MKHCLLVMEDMGRQWWGKVYDSVTMGEVMTNGTSFRTTNIMIVLFDSMIEGEFNFGGLHQLCIEQRMYCRGMIDGELPWRVLFAVTDLLFREYCYVVHGIPLSEAKERGGFFCPFP